MEQNNFGSTGDSQSQAGNGGTGGMGGAMTDGQASGGMKDRARELAGNAQERLADVGSSVRDRAGTLKDSLADALETGADKLRQRTGASGANGDGQLAGSTGSGSMAIENDGRVTQV